MSESPSITVAIEQVSTLAPDVLADARNRDTGEGAADRVFALAVAAGRLLRLAEALEACGEPEAVRSLTQPAWLALRRRASEVLSVEALLARLVALARGVQQIALESRDLSDQSVLPVDHGDPLAAAQRWEALEEADDLLSALRAVSFVQGRDLPPEVFPVATRIGRYLSRGLRPATWWRVEAVATCERDDRALFADPAGRPLWVSLLEPDRRAELLAEASERNAQGDRLAAHTPVPERVGAPGEIELLLYDAPRQRGRVVTLRVERRSGAGVWVDPTWSERAWTAVRRAYRAAAGEQPFGIAPARLEDHALRINAQVHVDGDSLGLPLAVAFASLWAEQGVPHGTCATGVIGPDGKVAPVDSASLVLKVQEARDQYGEAGATVLVPDQAEAPVGTVRCPTLGVALEACGIARATALHPDSDVVTREDQLRSAMRAVDQQDLGRAPSVSGGSPWALLGDWIDGLVRSLQGEPNLDVDLRVARMKAALAWLHAGELDEVERALRDLGDEPLPVELALMRETVALAKAIDRVDLEHGRPHDEALEALLASRSDGGPDVHLAVGTRGRWRLHLGDGAGALPWLERAVAIAPAFERARSRVYLSQALRAVGRPQDAAREIAKARDDLQETRRRSESYAGTTEVYLDYEASRVALAVGRPHEAVEHADRALARALRGSFWPRAGILRTLAQAARGSGDIARAHKAQNELEAVLASAPPSYGPLWAAILAEARGEPVDPPVVY